MLSGDTVIVKLKIAVSPDNIGLKSQQYSTVVVVFDTDTVAGLQLGPDP